MTSIRMLKHKETGEEFVWTSLLSKLPELEEVDPVELALKQVPPATKTATSTSKVEVPSFIKPAVQKPAVQKSKSTTKG